MLNVLEGRHKNTTAYFKLSNTYKLICHRLGIYYIIRSQKIVF